jgi:hypothetical protein
MIKRICPKCKTICDLDENEVSLGSAKCKCGASIEVLSALSHTEPSQTKIPEPVKEASDPKPEPPSQTIAGSNINEPPSPGIVTSGKFDRRYLWPFLFILISLGIVYGLWRLNWITALMVISIFSTLICWMAKREGKKDLDKTKGAKNQLAYFFFDKSLEFFVPLTFVIIFYRILAWFVDWNNTDKSTIGALQGLQTQLDSFLYYLSWFKLKPWIAALIIFGVILLDLLLSIFFSFKDLGSYYKHYSLWSKRVFTTVFLLCCFTFFGEAVGEKRAELSKRVDHINNGYSRVQEKASQMLTDAVQERLYKKVQGSFPADIKAGLTYLSDIDKKLHELNISVFYAKAADVDLSTAPEIMERYSTLEKKPPAFSDDPIRYSEAEPVVKPKTSSMKPATDASTESIDRLVNEVEKPSFRQKLASLIESGGGKQLFCQFPKSFTNMIKSAVFEEAVRKYPIIEPIVEVFVGTFDKTVEEKVDASADRIAETLVKDRASVSKVVAEEAQKIVDSTDVKVSSSSIDRLRKIIADIKQKFNEIESVDIKLREKTKAAVTFEAKNPLTGNADNAEEKKYYTCNCVDSKTHAVIRVIWGPLLTTEAFTKLHCAPGPC